MFPFIDAEIAKSITSVSKEYSWDFENNDFALQNGKPYLVEGAEAIKVWIYKTLKTSRYNYTAYSWDYGVEFESLLGRRLSKAYIDIELSRMVKEALMVNENILSVTVTSWKRTGNILTLEIEVKTKYGEVSLSV